MIPRQTDFCRYFSRFLVLVFADFCRFGRQPVTDFSRFLTVFAGLHWVRIIPLLAAVGAACSAAPPDFGRVFLPLLFWCVVDDFPAGVMCASGVLKDGLGVLREIRCSGVKLACPFSLACPRHRKP
jgi:hypothetical protein